MLVHESPESKAAVNAAVRETWYALGKKVKDVMGNLQRQDVLNEKRDLHEMIVASQANLMWKTDGSHRVALVAQTMTTFAERCGAIGLESLYQAASSAARVLRDVLEHRFC